MDELTSFDEVKLLSVAVDRLTKWYKPGLLCIGDAAHAMSPVGGVGINLAIQDAVATANLLAAKLKSGTLKDHDLERVQRRRLLPVRLIQRFQVAVQNRVLRPACQGGARTEGALLAGAALIAMHGCVAAPAQIIGPGPPEYRRPTWSGPEPRIERFRENLR